MMQETLRRRLRYLQPDTNAPGEDDEACIAPDERTIATPVAAERKFHKRPDLIIIDGGKGQLSAVVEVLEELDLWGIPVAGLAKEHEWLYVPGQSEPIVLPPGRPPCTSSCVFEMRRTASPSSTTAQRRGKAMTRSALDAMEGIGAVRENVCSRPSARSAPCEKPASTRSPPSKE